SRSTSALTTNHAREWPVPAISRSSFFFTAPATTEIYTLSLHDALPISPVPGDLALNGDARRGDAEALAKLPHSRDQIASVEASRSEEHTSELQSRENLVCRLLLEKKKKKKKIKNK